MGVEQATVIDFIGIDTVSGAVHLTIADALEWDAAHRRLLQEKLNAYLAFVESGELCSVYPGAAERPLVLDVRLRYRPDADATRFLQGAAALVASAGLSLQYGPLDGGYANDNGWAPFSFGHARAQRRLRLRYVLASRDQGPHAGAVGRFRYSRANT